MVSPGISVKEVASAVTGANPFMQSGRIDAKHNRTVVIVDDESTGRLILGKIIQQVADDITIVDFESALEALAWLDDNQADLIVTDYKMPEK